MRHFLKALAACLLLWVAQGSSQAAVTWYPVNRGLNPNDQRGDSAWTAFGKINQSFTNVVAALTNSGGGSTTLSNLTDVDVAGVVNGQALVFDGTEWVPGSPAAAGSIATNNGTGTGTTLIGARIPTTDPLSFTNQPLYLLIADSNGDPGNRVHAWPNMMARMTNAYQRLDIATFARSGTTIQGWTSIVESVIGPVLNANSNRIVIVGEALGLNDNTGGRTMTQQTNDLRILWQIVTNNRPWVRLQTIAYTGTTNTIDQSIRASVNAFKSNAVATLGLAHYFADGTVGDAHLSDFKHYNPMGDFLTASNVVASLNNLPNQPQRLGPTMVGARVVAPGPGTTALQVLGNQFNDGTISLFDGTNKIWEVSKLGSALNNYQYLFYGNQAIKRDSAGNNQEFQYILSNDGSVFQNDAGLNFFVGGYALNLTNIGGAPAARFPSGTTAFFGTNFQTSDLGSFYFTGLTSRNYARSFFQDAGFNIDGNIGVNSTDDVFEMFGSTGLRFGNSGSSQVFGAYAGALYGPASNFVQTAQGTIAQGAPLFIKTNSPVVFLDAASNAVASVTVSNNILSQVQTNSGGGGWWTMPGAARQLFGWTTNAFTFMRWPSGVMTDWTAMSQSLATNNAAGLTNYHQTNLVSGLQSWLAVPTSISLQQGVVPNIILAQTNTSFTVSSWVPVSGLPSNAQLVVSNSSGGNITATLTGTGRFFEGSTNSLVIGSGKVGVIYVESYTGAMTNIWTTRQP